ncbi:hypothetical protein [Nostoc sp. FACHB-888]|nr:hypothetical protein [Nostoc sp. FACHB-888]MBD2245230.1 hypothetical protein [Nostoc sp. FACHB-888]MCC5649913.1 hypothetical protein [Nostoc sp. XA013]
MTGNGDVNIHVRSLFLDIQKIIDEQGLKKNELGSAIAYNGTKPIGLT